MTPMGNLPTGAGAAAPDFNSISSAAGKLGAGSEQMAPEMSPAESAINRIGGVLTSFEEIANSFPGVGEAEKQEVFSAFARYMDKVVGSLNSSPSAAQQPANGGLIPEAANTALGY